jgi:hypothetical protein
MSSLLNLSDTLAAARLCAARSGDTLRSLLSPSSQGAGLLLPLVVGCLLPNCVIRWRAYQLWLLRAVMED